MNTRSLAVLFCLTLVLGFPGCRKERPAAPERRYELRGKIVAVDRASHELTIAHQDIPGFMVAMTMPFRVKDDWVFNTAAAGDDIRATLVVSGESHLEDVVITKRSSSGDASAGPRLPEVGDSVPDLSFVNQDGKKISLSAFRGKALVLTFIYTRCPLPDYCIRMSSNFGEIAKELKNNAKLHEKTQLLSISFDPKFDSPRVLRKYGSTYARTIDPSFTHWQFVTGTAEEVRKAADYFGVSYSEQQGQYVHSLRTAVIGPDGKIAALFPGNEWKPADVIHAISTMAL